MSHLEKAIRALAQELREQADSQHVQAQQHISEHERAFHRGAKIGLQTAAEQIDKFCEELFG